MNFTLTSFHFKIKNKIKLKIFYSKIEFEMTNKIKYSWRVKRHVYFSMSFCNLFSKLIIYSHSLWNWFFSWLGRVWIIDWAHTTPLFKSLHYKFIISVRYYYFYAISNFLFFFGLKTLLPKFQISYRCLWKNFGYFYQCKYNFFYLKKNKFWSTKNNINFFLCNMVEKSKSMFSPKKKREDKNMYLYNIFVNNQVEK